MMSKRLYSEVVSKGSSSEDDSEMRTPKSGCLVNWLREYQDDEEQVALEKALELSRVRFVTAFLYFYYRRKYN